MNYLSTTFVCNNNDIERNWKYEKDDIIITIVSNTKNGKSQEIRAGITTQIYNLQEYAQENEKYLKRSYENYLKCMNIKYIIEKLIEKSNLNVDEDFYQWTILNNVFKLSFKVYKITEDVSFSIQFKNDDFCMSEKVITREQLLSFLHTNKETINGVFQFPEREKYEHISEEYKKLFIKKPIQKRICTQMGKELHELEDKKYQSFKDEEDESLKLLQKKMRHCLKI